MSTKQTPEEVEEVKDLEQVEEVQDLKEAPEEVKEVQDLTEVPEEVKAPVLRGGGLRDAADPNMIQTHLDNFLAKICGETPVDVNPRNSAEYWLKRIADFASGLEDRHLYFHSLDIFNTYPKNNISAFIISSSNTSIDTVEKLENWFKSFGSVTKLFVNGVMKSGDKWYALYYIVYTPGTEKFSIYGWDINTPDGYVDIDDVSSLSTYFTNCSDSKNQLI